MDLYAGADLVKFIFVKIKFVIFFVGARLFFAFFAFRNLLGLTSSLRLLLLFTLLFVDVGFYEIFNPLAGFKQFIGNLFVELNELFLFLFSVVFQGREVKSNAFAFNDSVIN